MYQKAKLVKPNSAVITRTVMPAKPTPLVEDAVEVVKSTAIALVIVATVVLVGIATGCTNYVISQAEQDVASSTIYPRINDSEARRLAQFRQQSTHANHTLAKMRTQATGGVQ